MGATYLLHGQQTLGHDTVENTSLDAQGLDRLALLQSEADVRPGGRVDLSQVRLAILLCDEADQVSPVCSHDVVVLSISLKQLVVQLRL